MGTAICMNKSCRTSSSSDWKSGWPLRSGGFATLCFVCGSAFENLVYCETFHREESGWRECDSCKKPIHCGCASSKPFIEFLDLGGACCITCAKKFAQHSIRRDEVLNDYSTQMLSSVGSLPHNMGDTRINEDIVGKGRIFQLGKSKMDGDPNLLPQIPKGEANVSLGTINGEDVIPSYRELSSNFWNLNAQSGCSPHYPIAGSNVTLGVQDGFEANPQTSLNISLSTPPDPSNYSAKYPSVVMEGRDSINLPSPSQQGQRPRVILPKPSKSGLGLSMDASKGVVQQPRVARPPAEGRGRNQLLPRYWPRITDQELQQLSGEYPLILNSPVVPLFEKVLSASDAGRIGRLVLPKACAEAYFPPISQSEGTPIRIQDAKGKEWTFQFRFWPNNNSRMYVLEGVTPCIQSMQLQAGDTVIFSRRDPGGKLVIGSRKASVSSDTQDGEIAALANGTNGESSFSGVSTASGYSGTFQSMTENRNTHLHGLSEHMTAADSNVGWSKSDRNRGRIAENSVPLSMVKRPKNISSKSRRLLMHNEDVLELKLTWDEAQDLLRAPPSIKPTIVTVEDHEIEEFEEPPVLAKKTIFTVGPSGGQEQWAQCDMCCKWRRLPVDVLLPLRWTCAENFWESSRYSCSMPDEVGAKELENLLKHGKDLKRRRTVENHRVVQDHEPSGLDALASAAVLGDNAGESGETSVGATTKHPRHRPGCTCIVCIQPPSGKGKHHPTCTCNVCMTVKRRFKTLMLRKRIRQSEREAEIAQRDPVPPRENYELTNLKDDSGSHEMLQPQPLEVEADAEADRTTQSLVQLDQVSDNSDVQLDLNCHPDRSNEHMEQEMSAAVSITRLVHAAALPLDNYMKQNGLASFTSDASDPQTIEESGDVAAAAAGDDNDNNKVVKSESIRASASENKDEEKSSQSNQDQDVDDKS
ncbi:unnamed protein product [Rhodiola kirilowii]